VVQIIGDGNCLFFWAISYLLFQSEDEHWSLRNLIIRYENLNSYLFEERLTAINESTFKEHLRYLSGPDTWVTHVELFAVATYFPAQIFFCVDSPCQKWECLKPVVGNDNLRYFLVTEPPFDVAVSVTHFEMVYHARGHYSSVVDRILCLSHPELNGQVYSETIAILSNMYIMYSAHGILYMYKFSLSNPFLRLMHSIVCRALVRFIFYG